MAATRAVMHIHQSTKRGSRINNRDGNGKGEDDGNSNGDRNGNSDEDNIPGMCLVVIAVVAMSVLGGGSTRAMEEVATAAAEEANDGWGG